MQPNQLITLNKNFVSKISEYSYAFTDRKILTLSDYLDYFSKGQWNMLRSPIPYQFKILDKYRDNIYNTCSVSINQNFTLTTIIQVDEYFHIFMYWMYNEMFNDVVLQSEVVTKHGSRLPEFVKENAEFEFSLNTTFGFRQ